jgi:hypothetical protein
MGALWAAQVSLMLASAPLVAPVSSEKTLVAPLEHEDLAHQRLADPRDGRLITYFSTACCGSLVCGGCTCMPFGALIPVALIGTQSITIIAVGALVGGAVGLLGLASFVSGAAGYAAVLVTLNQMGLWDWDAAAQSCSDVMTLFSACWSFF